MSAEDRKTVPNKDHHEKRAGIAGTISGYFGQSKSAVRVGHETGVNHEDREAGDEYVPGGLLGELDVQQDEVIQRLDELNLKIERLMREWQSSFDDDDSESRSETEAA